MAQASLLIVDDEVDNFDVIETMLSGQDYQLNYVSSGQEAIASLNLFQPDLILLDVMMPEVDGLEVCHQIRSIRRWRAVPIIMITALTAKEDLARCLEVGADDFISKPINSTELRARIQSMLRIKQQYDDLQTLLRFREDMVNMLVHDLRNRLTELMLGFEFLADENYSVTQQELAQIHTSAQTLQGLIDDLLKVALIKSGKFRLNLAKADLLNFIQSAIANSEAIAAQKELSLTFQILEGPPMRSVSFDVAMMHRVLDNLLSNAIKFSPPNSKIQVKAAFPTLEQFKIQVIDFGPGIADELHEKIFEKYEIGTPQPNVSQTGLGLAFCKMVVEAHGGSIQVKNNPPQGAVFEITLPTR